MELKEDTENNSLFPAFPGIKEDLFGEILLFLDPESLLNLSLVNKFWNRILNKYVWRILCLKNNKAATKLRQKWDSFFSDWKQCFFLIKNVNILSNIEFEVVQNEIKMGLHFLEIPLLGSKEVEDEEKTVDWLQKVVSHACSIGILDNHFTEIYQLVDDSISRVATSLLSLLTNLKIAPTFVKKPLHKKPLSEFTDSKEGKEEIEDSIKAMDVDLFEEIPSPELVQLLADHFQTDYVGLVTNFYEIWKKYRKYLGYLAIIFLSLPISMASDYTLLNIKQIGINYLKRFFLSFLVDIIQTSSQALHGDYIEHTKMLDIFTLFEISGYTMNYTEYWKEQKRKSKEEAAKSPFTPAFVFIQSSDNLCLIKLAIDSLKNMTPHFDDDLNISSTGLIDDIDSAVSKVLVFPCKHPILKKIGTYLQYHANDLPISLQPQVPLNQHRTDDIIPWDLEFCQVDQSTLFEMILTANSVSIKPLLDLTCKTVANMIKGKTPEEIRNTFNIKNDFTPEEEEQVRKENEWCEEI